MESELLNAILCSFLFAGGMVYFMIRAGNGIQKFFEKEHGTPELRKEIYDQCLESAAKSKIIQKSYCPEPFDSKALSQEEKDLLFQIDLAHKLNSSKVYNLPE